MTREHLGLCLALKVPVFVVLTKTDLVSAEQRQRVLDEVISKDLEYEYET